MSTISASRPSGPIADAIEAGGPKQSELKAKDFKTDQEVRWCPGCGDYVILNAVQGFLPSLGIAREDMVIVSGIGCSSRFPYYMNTYGMHSIHGRAPAIATGLAASRPDLSVWVVTGDGDALSIGGNHLIHALRRNVNLKILLFNNRIYGLTKGQYSPTSEVGKITKSTPDGLARRPVQPGVAGARRRGDVRRPDDGLRPQGPHRRCCAQAAEHEGTALVEIYQNCNIFNDGAFDLLKDPATGDDWTIPLEHGQPLVFGADGPPAWSRDGVRGAADRRDQPGRRRDRGPRRAPGEPGLRVRALPALHPGPRYAPMGVFRSSRADLRRADDRRSSRPPEREPVRPTSAGCSPETTPGPSGSDRLPRPASRTRAGTSQLRRQGGNDHRRGFRPGPGLGSAVRGGRRAGGLRRSQRGRRWRSPRTRSSARAARRSRWVPTCPWPRTPNG